MVSTSATYSEGAEGALLEQCTFPEPRRRWDAYPFSSVFPVTFWDPAEHWADQAHSGLMVTAIV